MTKPTRHIGVQAADAPAWSGCTILIDDNGFCDAPIPSGAPISACVRHLLAAFTHCQELIARASTAELAHASIEDAPLSAGGSIRDRLRESMSVVYYLRVGPHIKIGRTVHLPKRVRQLRADELLATEPGDHRLELSRLKQFAHLKVDDGRREYFTPGPELLRHISELGAQGESLRSAR